MRIFTRVLDFLEKILRLATSCLFVVMVASIAYQIVLRYIFSKANAWSEELARYAFVWLVMLAASLGARRGRHMCIDFIVEKLPVLLKNLVAMTTRLLAVFFFLVLGWKGSELLSFTMNQNSTGLEISMAFIYLAIPVGAFFMILFSVEDILLRLAGGSLPAASKEAV
ncbi:TRAP transporter small permease [uncultured Fretibacterium sp.]|uniref:TRAP transporter small permease n=1 Tax=uncultured Fretibacterium sp. TaxID=1678694 RepID=UPI00325FD50B